MNLRDAAQQALEALETCDAAHPSDGGRQWYDDKLVEQAITALRAALAEPQPEPVLQTCNCRWDGEAQVQQCTLHEAHVDAIYEWAERAKTAEKKLVALAEPQPEPVAWMHTQIECNVITHKPRDLDRHPDRWIPLFKDPTPCKTCQALAMAVMADQTSHDTRLPQRQPLTDDQINALELPESGKGTIRDLVRIVEAAHGIGGDK